MKNKRLPFYFTAPNGSERVRLPLAKNRGEALFDRKSFEYLMNCGYSSQMRLTSSRNSKLRYVRSRHPDKGECSLTRSITGADKNQHTHFRDGNPLNLTLENLAVIDRGGGFNPRCPLCRPRPGSEDYRPKRRARRPRKGKQNPKIPQISVRPSVSYRVAFTPPYPLGLSAGLPAPTSAHPSL